MGSSRKLATFGFGAVMALGLLLMLRTTRDPRPDRNVASAAETDGTTAAARGERERVEGEVRDASTARDAVITTPLRVHGTLTRGGLPVAGRRVVLFDPRSRGVEFAITDPQGAWSFPVGPGIYHVGVPFVGTELMTATDYRLMPHSRPAIVGSESVWMPIELGKGTVNLRIVDASTTLGVAGTLVSLDRQLTKRSLTTDGAGHVRFDDLDPREVTFSIHKRGYSGQSVRSPLSEQQPHASLEVALMPWGALDVEFVDAHGAASPVSMLMPMWLFSSRQQLAWPAKNSVKTGATTPTPVGGRPSLHERSWDLPPDTYHLAIADHFEADGTERFEPFAPISTELVVPGGIVTRVSIPTRRRARVQVRIDPPAETNARIQLAVERLDPDLGVRRVRPVQWMLDQRESTLHFDGYLIPGTYSLSFALDGRRHVETVVVDTADIARSFRMPW